ncbi:hypothetical protein ACWOAN_02255 [Lactococcus taiwanensis]|uniref:hypothetical protein n=1 Tax=Lactococcus taiwanensis TaxID=1151742 RepID=UPI001906301F|nr:hypothetical protein [Lactococcus taiwanensis]
MNNTKGLPRKEELINNVEAYKQILDEQISQNRTSINKVQMSDAQYDTLDKLSGLFFPM